MKRKFYTVFFAMSLSASAFGQAANNNKDIADSLVNEWNVRFNSDIPSKMEEILAENVNEISGDAGNYGRDSVMVNFVEKRMPVISDLKAVNEFYSVSKDMVFTAGGYTLKVKKADGQFSEAMGNYTFIWTRQKDQTFKIEFIHIESVPKK